MSYSLVKLSPTTANAAVAAGDVLFDSTEFILPAKAAKLVSVTLVDYKNNLVDDEFTFVFHQDNAGGTFGAAGAAEALSSANALLNVPIAVIPVKSGTSGKFANMNILHENELSNSRSVVLERDDVDRKMYVTCICTVAAAAGTIAGDNSDGSDLAVLLGFEY